MAKHLVMKKLIINLGIILITGLSSCVYVVDTPGPPGRNGRAFFGVDYERFAPYSYWDNNPSIPFEPILGHYYQTGTGIFDFEYFVNATDYYYGTYEVWINPGGPGGSYGEPGFDGLDTYLMLVLDPYWGVSEWRDSYKTGEPIVIERNDGEKQYRITMHPATTDDRAAHEPKLTQ